MDYENVLGESRFPNYDQLKDGLLRLIDEGRITREDASRILPELRESEDERIRKEIVGVIQKHYPNTPESYRWISWLEKQKEPEKEELVYRLNGLMQEYINEAKDQEEEEHRFKCYKLFWNALEDASYFEQKEQNPVEWSEEDEKMLSDLRNTLGCLMNAGAITFKTKKKFSNWLKSLRPNKQD